MILIIIVLAKFRFYPDLLGGHSRPHLSPFVPVPFGILHVKGREIGDEWGQMGTIRDKWGQMGTRRDKILEIFSKSYWEFFNSTLEEVFILSY